MSNTIPPFAGAIPAAVATSNSFKSGAGNDGKCIVCPTCSVNCIMPGSLLIALLALNSTPPSAPALTADTQAAISAAQSAILQADGVRARDRLAALPADALAPADRDFRACSLARLDGSADVTNDGAPAFIRQLLGIYHHYWRDSVMVPAERDAARDRLRDALADLLELPRTLPLDTIMERAKARIEASGFHAINGRTSLLHDLILWGAQEERLETVSLPEGPVTARVFYLDGFQSRGWASYLTCDRTGTGGWATEDGLYVVVPSYDLASENFRVSFLAHESQHFSDYARFPGLVSWELEYRAKLVELSYADTTRERLLTRFASNQGDSPDEAHSYANRRVLAALRVRLSILGDGDLATVSPAVLRQAALAELHANSALLSERRRTAADRPR